MKTIYWILVCILVLGNVVLGWTVYNQVYVPNENLGQGFIANGPVKLVGTSSGTTIQDAETLPSAFCFCDSTTTEIIEHNGGDGGATITQLVTTGGQEGVYLTIVGRSRTATSVLSIYPQISYDGTNYYPLIGTSTTTDAMGTTTVDIAPYVWNYTPGTVTTTISTPIFNTRGALSTRFMFMGTNIPADPTDGVDAYIQAIPVEKIVR